LSLTKGQLGTVVQASELDYQVQIQQLQEKILMLDIEKRDLKQDREILA
jgi:hypothetical protein